jgi:hypothetical protein
LSEKAPQAPNNGMPRRASMSIDHKDYLHLLSDQPALKRRLSKAEITKLAKGFRKSKSGEPSNTGVAKKVGVKMIRAAAKTAERRIQKGKTG